MTKTVTAPFMHSTDVDVDNDYANEMAGVDRTKGLYVLDSAGIDINFSLEVQQQIFDALGDYLESIS